MVTRQQTAYLHSDGGVNLQKLQFEPPNILPRFLYRTHSSLSRGLTTENGFYSQKAVQENAMKQDSPPPYHNLDLSSFSTLRLDDCPPDDLKKDVRQHLTNFQTFGGVTFESPFVSLTTSLRLAMTWAHLRLQHEAQDVKIAIIDTTKLTSNAPIWHAPFLFGLVGGYKQINFQEEYLAYSHVTGTLHHVSYQQIQTGHLQRCFPELAYVDRKTKWEELPSQQAHMWLQPYSLQEQDLKDTLYIAKQMSNDRNFIPVLASVLSLRRRNLEEAALFDLFVFAAQSKRRKHQYNMLEKLATIEIYDYFSNASS